MKPVLVALVVGLSLTTAALAASTINPAVPAQNSPMSSAPIRGNFQAAANDINNLLAKFGSTSAPASPTTFQDWMNTSSQPRVWSLFDGTTWVTVGTLNTSTHTFSGAAGAPTGSAGGDLGGTYPNPTVVSVAHVASGTLIVANGGTGLTTGTSGGVPYFSTTSIMASSGALAINGLVIGGGPGNPPTTVALTGLVLGHGVSTPTAYTGVGAVSHQFITALSAAGAGTLAQPAFTDISGTATSAQLPADVMYTDQNQTLTKAQRGQPVTVSPSGATYTPNFDAANNFPITLVHASCPCTFANPSTTPVAGQSGVIVVIQSATGSDTIGTWGSDYISAGGTSTIALSTAANAMDFFSYYVQDATHIVVSAGALNATH